MKFLLSLSIVLALAVGGCRSILTVENDVRDRVQLVQSGATMIRDGKAMMEKGVWGRK